MRIEWLCVSLGATGLVANATPLNLMLEASPDIDSFFIDTSYDATADAFDASGFAASLFDGTTDWPITNGQFDIDATIGSDGSFVVGTLVISGGVPGLSISDSVLVSGTISDFGFGNGSILEFVFDVDGGALASEYGAQAGVILGDSGYGGSWDADWSGSGIAVSDTAPPVPAPAAFVALGVLGMGRRRR